LSAGYYNFFLALLLIASMQAHHEKFIVIDHKMAFIGGLDLCFGRWDMHHHPLADIHPAGVANEIWPGQE
jgi:phospholipase D1/2